ncbi:MAG: hypothetical protein ABFS05_11805 [Bacteroidota bacterium]
MLICGETPASGGTDQLSWHLANPTTPPDPDYDEFWNDTYLMWKMLIEMGYENENIYVIFGGQGQAEDWSADPENDVAPGIYPYSISINDNICCTNKIIKMSK